METFRIEPTQTSRTTLHLSGGEGLSSGVLFRNACWFTYIRWGVVAVFAAFGAVSRWAPDALRKVAVEPPALWPWVLAAIVALVNGGVIAWLRRLPSHEPMRVPVKANIWFQIVADLLVLTVLVYLTGILDTVIPFAYLFHITLACIFFGRRDSLLVTLMSVALFLAAVMLEGLDFLPPAGILTASAPETPNLLAAITFIFPAVFVWLVVWFLASSLSETVRLRDRNLAAANERILQADEAINRQMLRVTHDLKAPFSGIESNIQILKRMHWDETPESVRQIINKIDARSATLRTRIGDILTLGRLRSAPDGAGTAESVDLRGLLEAVCHEVQGQAREKQVSVVFDAVESRLRSDPEQLKILFANIVSNAIVYSHAGGTVTIGIKRTHDGARVRVADHGIGIGQDALAHVFEDFYRTPAAAAFNSNATGLGLAIVRQVARNLRLSITVESEAGQGTVFDVHIPSQQQENSHGANHANRR